MTDAAERPLASEETENRVKETFTIDVSPEEFAARDGYGWLDFPFGRYRYRDSQLDEWIQAVKEILSSPDKLRECQSKYLTPAEMQLIAKYLEDDLDSLDD
jgi:hypothetical protein